VAVKRVLIDIASFQRLNAKAPKTAKVRRERSGQEYVRVPDACAVHTARAVHDLPQDRAVAPFILF